MELERTVAARPTGEVCCVPVPPTPRAAPRAESDTDTRVSDGDQPHPLSYQDTPRSQRLTANSQRRMNTTTQHLSQIRPYAEGVRRIAYGKSPPGSVIHVHCPCHIRCHPCHLLSSPRPCSCHIRPSPHPAHATSAVTAPRYRNPPMLQPPNRCCTVNASLERGDLGVHISQVVPDDVRCREACSLQTRHARLHLPSPGWPRAQQSVERTGLACKQLAGALQHGSNGTANAILV